MTRPSRHIRIVRTRKGRRRRIINPYIRKRKHYSALPLHLSRAERRGGLELATIKLSDSSDPQYRIETDAQTEEAMRRFQEQRRKQFEYNPREIGYSGLELETKKYKR